MKGTHLSSGQRGRGGVRGLFVVMCLVAYCGFPAHATDDSRRDTIGSIPVVRSTSCPGSIPRNSERRLPPPPVAPETIQACHLTASELRRALGGRPPLVIDIRSSRDYERAHLPVAINVLGDLVPHKSFVKHRDVVLVGDGYGSDQSLRLCERLLAIGVPRVRVLSGGVAGWVSQGYPVRGRERVPARLLALSPVEALAAASHQNWIFVVDTSDDAERIEGYAEQPRVEFDPDVEALAGAVRVANGDAKASTRVLITSMNSRAHEIALQLARRLPSSEVRFVEGGAHALNVARREQTAILDRPDLNARSLSRCGG